MAKKKPIRQPRAKKPQPPLQLNHLIVCDAVARDPNTSKATLYGLFDNITLDGVPQKAAFSVFAKVAGRGKYQVAIVLIDPKGASRPLSEASIDLQKDGHGMIQVMVGGIDLHHFGVHKIQVKSGGRKIGNSCIFEVIKK